MMRVQQRPLLLSPQALPEQQPPEQQHLPKQQLQVQKTLPERMSRRGRGVWVFAENTQTPPATTARCEYQQYGCR